MEIAIDASLAVKMNKMKLHRELGMEPDGWQEFLARRGSNAVGKKPRRSSGIGHGNGGTSGHSVSPSESSTGLPPSSPPLLPPDSDDDDDEVDGTLNSQPPHPVNPLLLNPRYIGYSSDADDLEGDEVTPGEVPSRKHGISNAETNGTPRAGTREQNGLESGIGRSTADGQDLMRTGGGNIRRRVQTSSDMVTESEGDEEDQRCKHYYAKSLDSTFKLLTCVSCV